MIDLKPPRAAHRSNPVKFALILLSLLLLSLAIAPTFKRLVCSVVDKQIAVWDAELAAHRQTLVSE